MKVGVYFQNFLTYVEGLSSKELFEVAYYPTRPKACLFRLGLQLVFRFLEGFDLFLG
jgi:hypothetical protein